jgi:hypothetical protein
MMSLIKTLKKGAAGAASSYKLVLLIWFTTLVLTLVVGFPLRSFLNSVFGNSMAVERLSDGFDLGLIGDFGKTFGSLMAALSAGTIIVSFAGFILFTFFTGGLFTRFTTAWGGLGVSDFLKASANNFIPFLKIALLLMIAIAVFSFIIIGIPALVIIPSSGGATDASGLMYFFDGLWLLAMPVWLFVADYSRRWIASTGSRKTFRAVGAGFRALREHFWLSYGTIFTVTVISSLYFFFAIWFAAVATPERGVLILLFFIVTQVLFILRILIKAWRYASVCQVGN